MKATYHHHNFEFSFTESDVVELDDWIPNGEYNPYSVRPWLIHDHGFTLCVVFASNLQDALDTAAYEGKLGRYQVTGDDWRDYGETENEAYEALTCLGGGGEFFDIESIGYVELPNPSRSFVAQFNAHQTTPKGL